MQLHLCSSTSLSTLSNSEMTKTSISSFPNELLKRVIDIIQIGDSMSSSRSGRYSDEISHSLVAADPQSCP